ncbi:MAG TPA: histidine kinase [Terriglobia bacterium]|nr:histidine kinase [Terriglobia bacterium]
MSRDQLYLICFAAGAVIHGVQTVLVAKRWRHTTGIDHSYVRQATAIGIVTFFWQFGNFLHVFLSTVGFPETAFLFRASGVIFNGALVAFPALFGSMCNNIQNGRIGASPLIRFGRYLRYPLWPWTAFAFVAVVRAEWDLPPVLLSMSFVSMATLHLMLLYFVILTVFGVLNRRETRASGVPALARAARASAIAGFLAAGMFVLMLAGYWRVPIPFFPYIVLAAMMTSVPFTIAVAYRTYHFPFMDAFVREVLSGLILLAAFVTALSVGTALLPMNLQVLWVTVSAILLAYAKEPVTRWVERTFMGYEESVEEQEERIGIAIRALTRLDEFGARVSEILRSELDAEWAEIGQTPQPGAARKFEIEAPTRLWLSLGPRRGGRQYMSRQLRLARTAVLQLAAHHHQLSQHELRELTARAQMQALQAQINPHFLFNTLNVLANLIHTNPEKAERITEELAEIFRYALESTRAEWVSLDDELRFLESYLEIEKARFEERLAYSFDVDPAVRSLKIPPMILQPLVENAVKHGISPKVEGGEVRVTARADADRLVVLVEDSGVGHQAKSRQRGSGIGLNNVRARLEHVYGEAGTLQLQERTPAGTRVLLVLPQLVGVHS